MKLNHQVMYQLVNKKQGFTLIESTVAIMILSIGLFAVVQFFPFGLQIIGNANNRTIAANLASSKMEEIRSLNYSSINTGVIEAKQPISSDPNNYLYDYQRETTVELIDSTFNSSVSDVGLKKISVTVHWQSPVLKTEQSYSINSVVSNF